MVSWTYAFKRGFFIWLWSIVWSIVGIAVALLVSGGSFLTLLSNPASISASSILGTIVGMVAGVIVGVLIATIGNYATIVKIVLESVEETKKPPQPPV